MYASNHRPHTARQVLFFILALCFFCSLILAVTAFSLEKAQQKAKEFDQSKQMLVAAKILNHSGFFEILQKNGVSVKANFDLQNNVLMPDTEAPKATDDQINKIATFRIRPLLTDMNGNVYTLEEKNLTLSDYIAENKKAGFASLEFKLFYAILPNEKETPNTSGNDIRTNLEKSDAYVFPVSGFGLWAPIYGYIAISSDGNTVIGTSWYEHGETPGLGANITEAWWQKQFYGKSIFQESAGGKTDFQTADMGIIVVKGKVKDVYGNSPKAKSAVDGMSGATLTGDGVTAAYRNSLMQYRAFLIKLQKGKVHE